MTGWHAHLSLDYTLAPHVEADTIRMRTNAHGLKPFVMTHLRTLDGLQTVVKFIETKGMLV